MSITILTSSKSLRKTVNINEDGKWESKTPKPSYKYHAEELEVKSLIHFSKILNKLTKQHRKCMILGALKKEVWQDKKPHRRTKENLKTQKVQLLPLDIDGIDIGMEVTTSTDLKLVGGRVRGKLPPPFNTAQCLVQATAGYGKPGAKSNAVKVRLIFFNKYKLDSVRVGTFIMGEGVPGFDKSTLHPIQIIYTCAPRFNDEFLGNEDPVKVRLIGLDGDELALKDEDLPSVKVSEHAVELNQEEDVVVTAVHNAGLYLSKTDNNHDMRCFQPELHSDPTDDSGAWVGQQNGKLWAGCKHTGCGNGETNLIEDLKSYLIRGGNLDPEDLPQTDGSTYYEECVFVSGLGKFYHPPTGDIVTKQTFDMMTGCKSDIFVHGDMELGFAPGRVVSGLTFIPNGPDISTDLGLEYINTYRSPDTWLDIPEGAAVEQIWRTFKKHMDFLWDEYADLILDWYAHLVQYPEKRNTFVPLHISKEHGVGRTIVTDIMERVVGHCHARRTTIKRLVDGNFNDAFNDSILLTVNETSNRKEKYSISEELRDQLTDARGEINVKYGAMSTKTIYTSVQLNANDLNAIGLPEEDRRIFIHLITKKEKSWEYYNQLGELLNDGAAAVLRRKLAERDLTEFEKLKRAPETHAKSEMIENSGTALDWILRDIRSKWPEDVISPSQLISIVNILEDREGLPQTDIYNQSWGSACRHNFTKAGRTKNKKLYFEDKRILPWVIRNETAWRNEPNHAWVDCLEKSKKSLKMLANDETIGLEELALDI